MTAHLMHLVRETARESYERVCSDGLLGASQMAAFAVICVQGPCTARELDNKIFAADRGERSLQPRLHEMVKSGVLIESGERECTVTGRRAIVYEVAPPGTTVAAHEHRPSKQEIGRALQQLKLLFEIARSAGQEPGDDIKKVGRWLVDRIRR